MRWARIFDTRSSLGPTSVVSRISCFSSGEASMKVATMSASAPGCSAPWMVARSSSGACGRSRTASSAWALRWSICQNKSSRGFPTVLSIKRR